ncbi:PREDICTED: interferon kappa-like [Thamnophis sirtalis]|uniref:Interferon kappa-like n=1 Tax=Thamnophis sirtalis TaxID=35019 RepID=A0A6I9YFM7_9SAUR|nr:PREDICTED: interferon kappa-like [Thamnophis sirtalis]
MPSKRTPVPMGLLCLVLLLAAPTWGSNCNLLKLHQRRLNRQSVELLRRVKGKFPAECLRKIPVFSFPVKILGIREPREATKAVLEVLQGFLHILKDEHRWVAWKATLQKRFLPMLHAQIQRIQGCLGEGKPAPGRRKEEWMHKLQLKKYFRSIGNFLEENGLDSCTREFVRHEIQLDFIYLDRLTERMEI